MLYEKMRTPLACGDEDETETTAGEGVSRRERGGDPDRHFLNVPEGSCVRRTLF